MITAKSLSFSYKENSALSFPDLDLEKGKHCLLLGESGSGKTTLLHLLGGLLRGYAGSIQLVGTELSKLSEAELDHFRGQHMGFVFQKNHLISALTVEKNLMMAPFLAGMPIQSDRIDEVLSQLGMTQARKLKVTEISHGQAQRVAIARAVLNHPNIILADEPTSALDDSNCEKVITLLLDIASLNQSTLIVATHDHRLKSKISNQIQLQQP
jgi:putative ABC transport system ATP-binding protein